MLYTSKNSDDKNKKFYIVATMCGHCGEGYFIPVLMPVVAENLKEAMRAAEDIPRVKHDRKGAIIYAEERTENEYWMVRLLNNIDQYMIASTNDSSVKERRVVVPGIVDAVQNSIYGNKGLKKYQDKRDFKTAEQYAERYPLQRYFAPIANNDKFEFRKKVDFDELLPEYFTQTIRYDVIEAMKRGKDLAKLAREAKQAGELLSDEDYQEYNVYRRNKNCYISIMVLYCKIFSNKNPLGIKYFPEEHEVSYFCQEEQKNKYVKIPQDTQVEHKGSSTAEDKPLYSRKVEEDPIAKSLENHDEHINPAKVAPTALERFVKRMEKYKALARQTPGQFGEE